MPLTGDPDLFLSFDTRTPTGANNSFMQEQIGVDVFQLARNNFLFCGAAGPEAACTLGIGVLGWEESDFRIVVYGQGKDYLDTDKRSEQDSMLCNPGCEWRSLGDGVCNPQCNNSACFWDRRDCEKDRSGCKADCHPDWIGVGYCDEARHRPRRPLPPSPAPAPSHPPSSLATMPALPALPTPPHLRALLPLLCDAVATPHP